MPLPHTPADCERLLVHVNRQQNRYKRRDRSFGKRSFHDAASRIPLLARGPGFAAGCRCDTPVRLLDATATCLGAAGVSFQTHACDGLDLARIADAPPADRFVFSQLSRADYGLYTAINRRWKYVYSAPDQRELLFDRVRDPHETHDLADALIYQDHAWADQRVPGYEESV